MFHLDVLRILAHDTVVVYAEDVTRFCNPICGCDNVCTLQDFLLALLSAVIYIMSPIIVLMIVYCGFLFVKAQGKPEKIAEARRVLLWTLVGGLIILGSYAIAEALDVTIQGIIQG